MPGFAICKSSGNLTGLPPSLTGCVIIQTIFRTEAIRIAFSRREKFFSVILAAANTPLFFIWTRISEFHYWRCSIVLSCLACWQFLFHSCCFVYSAMATTARYSQFWSTLHSRFQGILFLYHCVLFHDFLFAFVGIMMCITDVSDEHMLPMLAGKLAYLFAFQANFRFIFIVLGLYSCAAWLDFIFGRFFRAKHMPLE